MVQLANLAGQRSLVRPPTSLPDEPTLPAFHKLTRLDLSEMANKVLASQEGTVFSAFITLVANRSSSDPDILGTLRGNLAREIRGLNNLRLEFEGPMEDDVPPVDDDIPAPHTPGGSNG